MPSGTVVLRVAHSESWIVVAACLRSVRRAIAALHPKQAHNAAPVTNTAHLHIWNLFSALHPPPRDSSMAGRFSGAGGRLLIWHGVGGFLLCNTTTTTHVRVTTPADITVKKYPLNSRERSVGWLAQFGVGLRNQLVETGSAIRHRYITGRS